MTELTLQVSDDIAAQLMLIQGQLPRLLQQIAQSMPVDRPEASAFPAMNTQDVDVYNEFLDFLLSAPVPQEIIDFRVSDATQYRLSDLLEKNREDTLTVAEQGELDAYEQVEYVMTLLKAKAYRQLNQNEMTWVDE